MLSVCLKLRQTGQQLEIQLAGCKGDQGVMEAASLSETQRPELWPRPNMRVMTGWDRAVAGSGLAWT